MQPRTRDSIILTVSLCIGILVCAIILGIVKSMPTKEPPSNETYTITLYEGNMVLVRYADVPAQIFGGTGSVVAFKDAAGKYVMLSGTFILEED